ncbi:MAG: hypothetical protein JXB15_16055 [Anaerolineales bacterium]|nr:hypothetical protein [Anaerolineales bacterium]
MMKLFILFVLFLQQGISVWVKPAPSIVQSQPVVHALLFYSPYCGHCHYVIEEFLPPVVEKYGAQLNILVIDASQEAGYTLFMSVLEKFGIERAGVPMLIIGDQVLIGSVDIPGRFPGLIEQYLALGGVDWPDIPGMTEVLSAVQVSPSPSAISPTPTTDQQVLPLIIQEKTPTESGMSNPEPTANPALIISKNQMPGLADRLKRDPAGNTLSILVLLGMLAVLVRSVYTFDQTPVVHNLPTWIIPLLCLVGLGIAGYLAYVETAQVEAVCGPVGDCNTVQQSEYALLFGFLPVGVLGVIGFMLILFTWLIGRFGQGLSPSLAWLAMLGMTTFGLLFSIYLTYLEPFVIGATCAWCLTSAVLMTALFWLSLAPGKAALAYLRKEKGWRLEKWKPI